MITKFKIFENKNNTITLYHGTSNIVGDYLINNGWKPREKGSGGNMGNPNYLYVTSSPEDALWFSNEIGENTVVEINNIPLEYIKPDPDDEAGFTMKELLDRMNTSKVPSKFIISTPLDKSHFKIYNTINESLLDKLQGPSKEDVNKQFDKFKLKKFLIFDDKVEIKKYFKLAVKIGDLDRVKKVMKTGLLSNYDIDTELFNDSLKCGNLELIKYLLDNFNIETNILTSYGIIDNKLNYDILNKIINKFNNEQLERLMDLTYKSVNIIDIILILLKNKIVKKIFIDNIFRRACYNNCYDSVYKIITEINYNVNNDEKKGFYMGVVNNNYDIVKLIVNSGLEYTDFDIEICEQMEINDNKNISKIIKLLKDNLKNK